MSKYMMYRRRGSAPDNSIVSQYVSRVIAAGGSVSNATALALNQFVQSMLNADLWQYMLEVSPICGSNLVAGLVKLKYLAGNPSSWGNNNFVGGDYQETGAGAGLVGNGTTKSLVNGLGIGSTIGNGHLCASVMAYTSTAGNHVALGVIDGTDQYWLGTLAGTTTFDGRWGGTVTASQASAPVAGMWGLSRITTTDLRLFLNGSQVGNSASSASGGGGGIGMDAFGYSNNGAAQALFPGRLAFLTYGYGLTSSQMQTLYLLISAFNAALTRS